MAKKSSMWGLGTAVAAVAGAVAGAVGMFLADEDNRKKVGKEVKKVEHEVEKDWMMLQPKKRKPAKKAAKRKTAKRRR